jgi:hypothetical protein
MQLTKEQTNQILTDAAQIVADRIWAEISGELEDVTCLSVIRAAAVMDLNPQQVRRMLKEYVAFGERDTRVTLAQLKQLIAARTVKAS